MFSFATPDVVTAGKLIVTALGSHATAVGQAIDRQTTSFERMFVIMSLAIQEFSARVNEAFGKISTSLDGVAGDVSALKDEIAKLQSSAGEISAEDQATLDSIEAKAVAISDKLSALDDQTVPPAPPSE